MYGIHKQTLLNMTNFALKTLQLEKKHQLYSTK